MDDRVERGERIGIGEHTVRHGLAVERAVIGDDAVTEVGHHRVEHGPAGALELAHDLIGVDEVRAAGDQARRDGRLSAADAAGQSEFAHPATLRARRRASHTEPHPAHTATLLSCT